MINGSQDRVLLIDFLTGIVRGQYQPARRSTRVLVDLFHAFLPHPRKTPFASCNHQATLQYSAPLSTTDIPLWFAQQRLSQVVSGFGYPTRCRIHVLDYAYLVPFFTSTQGLIGP
jgi:hypothetical protein